MWDEAARTAAAPGRRRPWRRGRPPEHVYVYTYIYIYIYIERER